MQERSRAAAIVIVPEPLFHTEKQDERFHLLLLVATLVATSTTYAKAKTTDELINDVEDLLNKAPGGVKAAPAAPAQKAKPVAPQAKPMAPQAAAVAAGGMRFQQAQAQQVPGKVLFPSPFGVRRSTRARTPLHMRRCKVAKCSTLL